MLNAYWFILVLISCFCFCFFLAKHLFVPDWNILHRRHWFCYRLEPAHTGSLFLKQDPDLFIRENCSMTHLCIIAWKYYTLPKAKSTTASWFSMVPLLSFGRYPTLLLRVMNALIEVGKLTSAAWKRNTFWMPLFLMECAKIRLSYMENLKKSHGVWSKLGIQ